MTLHDYVAILRRSWPIIVASAVVGLLITLAFSLTATKMYQAQSQLFVSVKTAEGVRDALTGGLFVQQRVESYVDVIDSPAVLDPVIAELGLEMTYTGLAEQVSASTPPNTVLLNVTVTDTDADRAAAISNAVAASYADEISRLEGGDPDAAETGGTNPNPVQASVIKPAEVPTSPVSPRTRVNVLLGLLLGLLIGVAVTVLRHTLDTSVKTVEDLEDASQSVALGAISLDPEAAQNPLVTLRGTARAEAFRSIRTNLQYVDVDNPPKSVVITSSMPSEGKSTTACNIAIALAQAGSRVMLIEADLRRPKVSEYLQVDGSRGLTDLLIGKATLSDAIIPWQRGLINFLPAGAIPPNPSELLGSHQMSSLLAYLSQHHDMIIIDAPPLLPVTDAAILATVADGAILIARHGVTSKEQLEESAEALRQVNARILGAVLNFTPLRKRRKYGYGYEYGYGYGYESDKKAATPSAQAPQPPQPPQPGGTYGYPATGLA